jgi:hypothetical protein
MLAQQQRQQQTRLQQQQQQQPSPAVQQSETQAALQVQGHFCQLLEELVSLGETPLGSMAVRSACINVARVALAVLA